MTSLPYILSFASLFLTLQSVVAQQGKKNGNGIPTQQYTFHSGAITRGDKSEKTLALVFTGDLFAEGLDHIRNVLLQHNIPASFFLTGNFYRNPEFATGIRALKDDGHSLGAHSDRHLLYCDWENRDSLLLSREAFVQDLENNFLEMKKFGIDKACFPYFLPPYEWYNDSISAWSRSLGLQLVNYTSGTLSHADYTVPGTSGYRSSREIFHSILEFERSSPAGLNGFILLMHTGSGPERTDKFYLRLDKLLEELTSLGYRFLPMSQLLDH
jgi:peptidoglycan/xylan/chitin deacetylase (PgdA/CDA1 family)